MFNTLGLISMLFSSSLFAAMPASGSYQLNNYGFGSGGTSNSTSTNYRVNATTGEVSGAQTTSTNYVSRTGNQNTQQADVPGAPTFTNPANYYNKLRFIVAPMPNPTDATYSIAVSTDNFTTTRYIQLDNTLGTTKAYQTYSGWGGASGQLLVGLASNTTYQMKVNAMQGNFTETEYGPTASAATVRPSITFDIDVAATDTETSAPYATSIGSLLPNTVVTGASRIWVDLTTNADSGAKVYAQSTNGGLRSSTLNFTLASATADLAVATTGFGTQSASVSQSSGGPFTAVAPYNSAGQNVGIIDATIREIFSTSTALVGGRASLNLKAKASAQTPAANDYQETLILTTAASF